MATVPEIVAVVTVSCSDLRSFEGQIQGRNKRNSRVQDIVK
jgi:hypothetical protein